MDEVWVIHPVFGKVKFSSPTPRQKEVLRYYGLLYTYDNGVNHEEEINRFLREKEKENSKKKI